MKKLLVLLNLLFLMAVNAWAEAKPAPIADCVKLGDKLERSGSMEQLSTLLEKKCPVIYRRG